MHGLVKGSQPHSSRCCGFLHGLELLRALYLGDEPELPLAVELLLWLKSLSPSRVPVATITTAENAGLDSFVVKSVEPQMLQNDRARVVPVSGRCRDRCEHCPGHGGFGDSTGRREW